VAVVSIAARFPDSLDTDVDEYAEAALGD